MAYRHPPVDSDVPLCHRLSDAGVTRTYVQPDVREDNDNDHVATGRNPGNI